MKSIIILLTFLTTGIALNPVESKSIDRTQSYAEFNIKNFGIWVDGTLKGIYGDIQFDKNNLEESSVKASVDIRGIRTGIKKRDEHLQKPDFFDTQKYPKITFESTKITKSEKGYSALGTLRMRGISKQVSIPFTVVDGVFKGKFSVNRKDYKLGVENNFNRAMGNEVKVELVSVVK